MEDEKIFSARQHLEAFITATQRVYELSSNTSDHMIAGLFNAIMERFNYLYGEIEAMDKVIDTQHEEMERLQNGWDQAFSISENLEKNIEERDRIINDLKEEISYLNNRISNGN